MKRSAEELDDGTADEDTLVVRQHSGSIDKSDLTTIDTATRTKCPYLDTIKRQYIDFDFEKVCSVSLTNLNVYACLCCGKFFQGRGRNTHCYTHSVQMSHHVFINLNTCKIYCLPDNYEVVDSSLDDIVRALRPAFTGYEIDFLNYNTTLARDIFGVSYLPGFIGLNNLKQTDYVNTVVHALAHVTPLRNFFLRPENYARSKSQLVHRFGELMRKIWSKHNYKSCVSPHELVQEVTVASRRRFVIGKQSEGVELLTWLLNELTYGICGTRKRRRQPTVIQEALQGVVHVTTRQRKTSAVKKDAELQKLQSGDAAEDDEMSMQDWSLDASETPFSVLTLDIPPTPLFKDSQGGNIIPQVPLFDVLDKYNGKKYTDILRAGYQQRKKYSLRKLPPFIIFHLSRFTKNNFYMEKNPTIVTFPVKNLELRDYVTFGDSNTPLPSKLDVPNMSIPEMKALLAEFKPSALPKMLEKDDFVNCINDLLDTLVTKYDLLANICHDSPPGQKRESNESPLEAGSYRVHIQNKATEQWYEIQDLHVQETMPQLVGLSESYMLIYERQKSAKEAAKEAAIKASDALQKELRHS